MFDLIELSIGVVALGFGLWLVFPQYVGFYLMLVGLSLVTSSLISIFYTE